MEGWGLQGMPGAGLMKVEFPWAGLPRGTMGRDLQGMTGAGLMKVKFQGAGLTRDARGGA